VAEEKNPKWRHQVIVIDREEMTIDGVASLGSYDEREIVMETEHGTLSIKGEGLDIKQLSLEKGTIQIEGFVHSIAYDDESRSRKGLLGRLFK